jgi:hypothetical protein
MTQDTDGTILSKRILEWLTFITAAGGALATIISAVSGGDAKRPAYAIAILFAMGLIIVIYLRRRRTRRLQIPEPIEPLGPSAALRGLLPFQEGEELPGRTQDVRDLFALVTSSSFRFGVLWGESGCGKTSLLCAGLVPMLRKNGFAPLYIPKPTKEPREAIRAELTKESDLADRVDKDLRELLSDAAPKGKKVIVILDQFEEYFLTNRTARSRASFVKWLGELVADSNLPITFLIGIRSDFGSKLHDFSPSVIEPTSTLTTRELRNFDVDQAKQVFKVAAKMDGVPFEPVLIDSVVNDLEVEGIVRPAELQIVASCH